MGQQYTTTMSPVNYVYSCFNNVIKQWFFNYVMVRKDTAACRQHFYQVKHYTTFFLPHRNCREKVVGWMVGV